MYKVKITIPYTPWLSKNKKFKYRTHKKLHENYIKAKDDITILFKAELRKHPRPLKEKTRVDYTWYRETMQGDPGNFREGIDDAIKVALPCDDNRIVGDCDYIMDKENPRLEITITIYEHEII